jgi:hypothetical protein
MSKKLVHDVALIATRLHDAGLTFEDAELAAQYCLMTELGLPTEPAFLGRILSRTRPADLLWGGFVWYDTPEGQAYWAALARDLS